MGKARRIAARAPEDRTMPPERTPPHLEGEDPSREGRIGRILAGCSDLLNQGRPIDARGILAENPDLAGELGEALDALRSIDPLLCSPRGERGAGGPLGTIGDFRLLRTIGRGGMGVVYEAWQTSMDRRVALKVLPSGIAADTKTFLRFMREARTAGKLAHPNVVSVHAMGVESDTPYYAMELVEGETLAHLIERLRSPRPSDAGIGGTGAGDAETSLMIPARPAGPGLEALEPTPLYCLRAAEAFAGAAEGLH